MSDLLGAVPASSGAFLGIAVALPALILLIVTARRSKTMCRVIGRALTAGCGLVFLLRLMLWQLGKVGPLFLWETVVSVLAFVVVSLRLRTAGRLLSLTLTVCLLAIGAGLSLLQTGGQYGGLACSLAALVCAAWPWVRRGRKQGGQEATVVPWAALVAIAAALVALVVPFVVSVGTAQTVCWLLSYALLLIPTLVLARVSSMRGAVPFEKALCGWLALGLGGAALVTLIAAAALKRDLYAYYILLPFAIQCAGLWLPAWRSLLEAPLAADMPMPVFEPTAVGCPARPKPLSARDKRRLRQADNAAVFYARMTAAPTQSPSSPIQ